MTLRALLRASSFEAPAVRGLSVQGFWDTIAEPVAATYNGKTFLCWEDDNKHIWAAHYVHATGALSTPCDLGQILTAVDGAIHLCPAILVRKSDHRIMVFAVGNGAGVQPGVWVSTNPEDATAFGTVTNFGVVSDYDYVQAVELSSGDIYVFGRHNGHALPARWGYWKSTDGGATWGSRVDMLGPKVGATGLYTRIGTDGTWIDMFVTDTNRAESPASVYHFRFDGTDLFQSDGTLIGSTFPYTADSGTLVKSSAEGSARPDGWGYAAGKPYCLILVESGSVTTIARVAAWSGSAWVVYNVTGADSGGFVGGNPFVGSGSIAKGDPFTVYFPQKVGGHFEMFRYRSSDGGATWTSAQLTSGSVVDHAMPDTPIDESPGLRAVWGAGTYTSDSNFDFTVMGFG